MDLLEIGFYTLSDERVRQAPESNCISRGEIIITEECNFRCPYCRGLDQTIYGDRTTKRLSLEEVKDRIDLWHPIKNIRFSGGEPTSHPDLIEIVRYAKSRGVERIAISTNGSSKTDLYRKLLEAGVNDFSISLDACCAEDGDRMAGGIKGAFNAVINNLEWLARRTYVTVGIVLTPTNLKGAANTISMAHQMGVSDIRVISAAQWNREPVELAGLEDWILRAHPILDYRIQRMRKGLSIRGIQDTDNYRCPLVLDDSVIAGDYFFPCVIYMREKGNPIGKVGPGMREARVAWLERTNTHKDPICQKNCLDVCVEYNNRYRDYHGSK
jgi:MoaA/NifB/PqqE/SkfB family radical SAM enzyme